MRSTRTLSLGFLLFVAWQAQGEAFVETALGTASDAAFFASTSAGASWVNSAQDFHLQLSGDAGVSYSDTSTRRTVLAEAGAELSTFVGPLVPLIRLSGGLDSNVAAGVGYHATLETALTANGTEASFFAEASATVERGLLNAQDYEARTGLSVLLGDFVVKPALGFAVAQSVGDLKSWSLVPALECSWYPGFPLTTTASTGYRKTSQPGTADSDSFLWSFELAAEPTDQFGFSLSSQAEHFSTEWIGATSGEWTVDLPRGDFGESWVFVKATLDYEVNAQTTLTGELQAGLAFSF